MVLLLSWLLWLVCLLLFCELCVVGVVVVCGPFLSRLGVRGQLRFGESLLLRGESILVRWGENEVQRRGCTL